MYLLEALAPGGESASQKIRVDFDNAEDVELVLCGGQGELPAFAGDQPFSFLVRPDGALFEQELMAVRLAPAGQSEMVTGLARVKRGRGELSGIGLKPGRYDVLFLPEGYFPRLLRNVPVPSPEPVLVELVPAPLRTFVVEVEDAPLPSKLLFFDTEKRLLRMAEVNRLGEAKLPGLEPGRYVVEARGAAEYLPVSLNLGSEDPVRLVFPTETVRGSRRKGQ